MIRFAYCAAALVTLTAATPAKSPDWRVSSTSGARPDRTVYLIDTHSIHRHRDRIDFTTQSVFESVNATRKFDRSVTRRRGNCATMSSQIMSNSYYANGALQNTDNVPSPNIITHQPGTVMYDVLSQACGTEKFQDGKVADPETQVRNYFAK